MNDKYRTLILGKIKTLLAQHIAAEGITHCGVRGSARESFLSSLLEQFMHDDYKIGHGEICDSNGTISNECDVIVHNTRKTPAALSHEQTGLFPIESIEYAIEVKTTVDGNALKDTINKFLNLLKLVFADDSDKRLRTALFGFKLEIPKKYKNVCHWLHSRLADESKEVCFLTAPPISVFCCGDQYAYFNYRKIPYSELYTITPSMMSTTISSGSISHHFHGLNIAEYESKNFTIQEWRLFDLASQEEAIINYLAGTVNTLHSFPVENYLLSDDKDWSVFACRLLDDQGKVLFEHLDFDTSVSTDWFNEFIKTLTLNVTDGKITFWDKTTAELAHDS